MTQTMTLTEVQLREIKDLWDEANIIVSWASRSTDVGEDSWSVAFSLIFGGDSPIRLRADKKLSSFGGLEWTDPDTSYQEDVRSWFEAFTRKWNHLAPLLNNLSRT